MGLSSKQIPSDKVSIGEGFVAHPATVLDVSLSSPQICLRLILVSGKTKDFIFSPEDSSAHIAQHVHENWPEGNDSLFFVLFFAWWRLESANHEQSQGQVTG